MTSPFICPSVIAKILQVTLSSWERTVKDVQHPTQGRVSSIAFKSNPNTSNLPSRVR
jgi:hypothetical protein